MQHLLLPRWAPPSSPLLQHQAALELTQQESACADRNFMTASLPLPRLHVYVRRLVEAGYKAGHHTLAGCLVSQVPSLHADGQDPAAALVAAAVGPCGLPEPGAAHRLASSGRRRPQP